jgi:CheY-like chemotaxis protein
MKRSTERPQEARIVVVDDDPGTVLVLANLLKSLGKVYVATRPDEAVSLALRVEPDLVLLDVEMPGADGFAVLKELRTHAQLADTLVLFVTSHGAADVEERALSAGAITPSTSLCTPTSFGHACATTWRSSSRVTSCAAGACSTG